MASLAIQEHRRVSWAAGDDRIDDMAAAVVVVVVVVAVAVAVKHRETVPEEKTLARRCRCHGARCCC